MSYNAIEVSYIGTGGEGNVETLRDFNTSYAHDCMNMVIIIIPESKTTMNLESDQASDPFILAFLLPLRVRHSDCQETSSLVDKFITLAWFS